MKGIFNKQGKMDRWPRDAWDVYTYNCVPIALADGTFRLYYQCYGIEGNANSGPAMVESDSITGPWTKPNVGEIEYPAGSGNFDNNLVVWRDSTGVVPYEFIDIIHDGSQYLLMGMNKQAQSCQVWTSADGLTFAFGATIYTGSDANGGEYAEPKCFLYDGATYKAYYRSMPGGASQVRSIGYYESASALSGYVDQGFLAEFISVAASLQYYDFMCWEHAGAWWSGCPLYKHPEQELGPCLLSRSTDSGATWEQRGLQIARGYYNTDLPEGSGEFDSVMVVTNKPILVGGRWYAIYGASPFKHDTWPRLMEFGMATEAEFDKKYDADLVFYAPFQDTDQLLPLIGPDGSCTRIGGGRAYYDRGGNLRYAAANTAVLDHHPTTGDALGLSCFDTVTSRVTQVDDLSHADWTKDDITIEANAALHIDGNLAMDRMVPSLNATRHRAFQQITSGAVEWQDMGAFFKDDGARYVGLTLLGAADDWCSIVLDMDTGILTEYEGVGAGSIQESGVDVLSDGRYYIWMVAVTAAANAFVIPYLLSSVPAVLDTSGGNVFTGELGKSAYVAGVNCHADTYHRPYAPSSPAADLIDFTDVSWFNESAGTWYLDLTPARLDVDSFVMELGASIADNITVWFDQPSGTVSFFKGTTTGDDGFISIAGVAVKGARLKIACAYANNDMVAYVNGVAGTPDVLVTLPPTNAATWFRIGSRLGGSLPYSGLIHDVRYFDVRKVDATVEAMSNGTHGAVSVSGNAVGGIGF